MTRPDFNPIAFLEQMLRIPSVSSQEDQVARFLVEQMQALGFHSYIDDAGNAVGEVGTGPEIVLLGHIDTVPGVVPVRIVLLEVQSTTFDSFPVKIVWNGYTEPQIHWTDDSVGVL